MNKKEVTEIKKNLSDDCGYMSINKVVTAYIDVDKNIRYYDNRMYNTMDSDTSELILGNVKNIFKGNIGKGLREYEFPISSKIQSLFYNTLHSKFITEEETKEFIQHIIDTYNCVSTYAIILMHCTYSVASSSKSMDDCEEDRDYDYNFMLCSLCPIELKFNGLVCTDEPEIVCEQHHTRVVNNPTDGFIYPTFSERQADVNSVLVYTNKPKDPNTSIVTETLGCEFTMSTKEQKETFNALLEGTLGKDLNYEMTTCINDLLLEKQVEGEHSTEPIRIGKEDIKVLLREAGVSETNIEHTANACESIIGNTKLDVAALTDTKITVKSGAFTLTYDHNYTHLVDTKIVNGKKVITIQIDEPITVNDINVDR